MVRYYTPIDWIWDDEELTERMDIKYPFNSEKMYLDILKVSKESAYVVLQNGQKGWLPMFFTQTIFLDNEEELFDGRYNTWNTKI